MQEKIPPAEEQPKPTDAPKEDQPKSAEASKEDQPKSVEAPTPKQDEAKPAKASTEEKPPILLAEGWRDTHQRKLEHGAYTFTATRTGNAALAYNAATREVKAVRLGTTKEQPLWVSPVVMEFSNDQVVALGVRGKKITRVALFNLKSGKWPPLDLDQPVNGGVWPMSFGPDTVAYEVGDLLYVFNPKTEAWDHLDLGTIADDNQKPHATKGRSGDGGSR